MTAKSISSVAHVVPVRALALLLQAAVLPLACAATPAHPGSISPAIAASAPTPAVHLQPATEVLAWNGKRLPHYPADALADHEEGTVNLHVFVGTDGLPLAIVPFLRPNEPRLAESLVAAAVRAVARWRFHPARRDGKIVEAWVDVPIRFSLTP